MYEIDLEKVWDLPWCIGRMSRDGSYCGIGKLINACGKTEDDNNFMNELGKILRSHYPNLDIMYDSNYPHAVGYQYHDKPIRNLNTIEEKTQFHQNFTRKLLEILLKEGFIKLKDSDLAIVKELKQYERVSVC